MADKSTIGFGLSQISNPTPEMANWIFRGYFIISKAVIGWLSAVHITDDKQTQMIVLTISLLGDPIMLGFSKLFGVIPQPVDPAQPFVANQQVDDKGDTVAIPDTVLPAQEPAGATIPVQPPSPPNAFEAAVQAKMGQ